MGQSVSKTIQPLEQSMEVMAIGSGWIELPPEILLLIARKLTALDDYIRFRSVCASWRLAASPKDLQFPWLVIPTLKEGCQLNKDGITTISFYNRDPTLQRCYHTVEVPETEGKWIYGSVHGWLLMIGSPQSKRASVSLLNPVTRAHIMLPPLLITDFACFDNIKKGIICSHPVSCLPGKLLVALWVTYGRLAIYREGDNRWVDIWHHCSDIADMAYFDKLYIVDHHGSLSLLQVESSTISPPLTHPLMEKFEFPTSSHLVEVAGDLLLVLPGMGRYVTDEKLVVFKLYKNQNGEWSWMNIGDMKLTHNFAFPLDWIEAPSIQASSDCKGYKMYFAMASNSNREDPVMIAAIRELHAMPGVGINLREHPNWKLIERVGQQRRWITIGVSWMVPSLQ